MVQEPVTRQIDSWSVAEENAAAWMRHWGHRDAACTSGGADGGVDVRSRTSLAQVKFEAVQVGSPAVQRLVGARGMDHHLALFFFSGAGFARPAIDYADVMGVALFKYDLTGSQTAVNQAAREVVRNSSARKPKRKHFWERRNFWWRRNWSLVVGLYLVIYAIVNSRRIIQRQGAIIEWYEPLIAMMLAVAFVYLWLWLHRRRRSPVDSSSIVTEGLRKQKRDSEPDMMHESASQTRGFRDAIDSGKDVGLNLFNRNANPELRECKDTTDQVAEDSPTQPQLDSSKDSGVS